MNYQNKPYTRSETSEAEAKAESEAYARAEALPVEKFSTPVNRLTARIATYESVCASLRAEAEAHTEAQREAHLTQRDHDNWHTREAEAALDDVLYFTRMRMIESAYEASQRYGYHQCSIGCTPNRFKSDYHAPVSHRTREDYDREAEARASRA